MKELSIEEKAKTPDGNYNAYTELINRLEDVKDAIKKQNYDIAMDILFKPYPKFQVTTHSKLAESEDERIRKQIKAFIKSRGSQITQSKTDAWLAWLEKQGEQKPVEPSIPEIVDEHFHEMIDNEQKPVIISKFRIGDWIVTDKNHVWFIDEDCSTTGYLYRLIGQNGNFEVADYNIVDNHAHLWTIQDAKDGDVLCDYSEAYDNPLIFILKKFECVNFGLVRPSDYSSYCFLTAGDIQRFKEGTYHHKHNIQPATKEQRDTLMKAMADAGYTFDFEKKELKKVEQKPVEWSEEDKKMIFMVITDLNLAHYVVRKGVAEKERKKEIEWLESFKDRVQPRPEQEWSEEDEKIRSSIINFIRYELNHNAYIGTAGVYSARQIDWLKSLRPQQKQGLSEDEEGIIATALSNTYSDDIATKLLNKIKSLRPQKQWKPSEEQMRALANALSLAKNCGEESSFDLRTLYEKLKKLREE